jgi:plastocyanin
MALRETRDGRAEIGAGGRPRSRFRFVRPVSRLVVTLVAFSRVPSTRAADVGGRVVDKAGNGVREAVVFVQTTPPGVTPPANPRPAVMDQINKTFVPHILPIVIGTEVSFPNHDQIHHHVYSFARAKTFEIPLYKGETAPPVRFDRLGAVKVGCNIHDSMSGVILVVPTPYFAMTDESGAFTLHDLPAGTYEIVAWQESSRTGLDDTAQTVKVGAGATPLTFTLDVAPALARPAARGPGRYE